MKRFRFLPYLPTLVVLVTITYLSLAEDPVHTKGIRLFEGADKLVHGCMYLGLVFAGCYDLYRASARFVASQVIWLVCGAIAWGGLMELLQGAMSMNRSADWCDFLANSCGALSGLLLGVYVLPYLFRRYKKSWLFQFLDNVD